MVLVTVRFLHARHVVLGEGEGLRVGPATIGIEGDRIVSVDEGPAAGAAVASLDAAADGMRFMDFGTLTLDGVEVWASRSGYTGEDGFEISVPEAHAEAPGGWPSRVVVTTSTRDSQAGRRSAPMSNPVASASPNRGRAELGRFPRRAVPKRKSPKTAGAVARWL